MADYIGTGFPQLACALIQMGYRIGENFCGHILEAGNFGGTEVKGRREQSKEEMIEKV